MIKQREKLASSSWRYLIIEGFDLLIKVTHAAMQTLNLDNQNSDFENVAVRKFTRIS